MSRCPYCTKCTVKTAVKYKNVSCLLEVTTFTINTGKVELNGTPAPYVSFTVKHHFFDFKEPLIFFKLRS